MVQGFAVNLFNQDKLDNLPTSTNYKKMHNF